MRRSYNRRRALGGVTYDKFQHSMQRSEARLGAQYRKQRWKSGKVWKPTAELKFHDLTTVDAVVAAGHSIMTLSANLIAQGTTEIERLGRRCVIRQIHWKWRITLPTDASGALSVGDSVRLLLYVDRQANGATASSSDILEVNDIHSFNNLANSGRFRTLMDRTYTLNASAGAGDGAVNDTAQTRIIGEFHKKVNIKIEFSGVTGAITEVRSNNIGIMLVGQTGVAAFQGRMRLRFTD